MEEIKLHEWDDEIQINLIDLLIVLAKRKRLIIGITMGVAICTAIISLIMSPVYMATTKILPRQKSSDSSDLASHLQMLDQAGVISILSGGALGIKTSNDLYIALLNSRPVLDRIIDMFDLMKLYNSKSRDEVRRSLKDKIMAQDDKKSGIITVNIEDKDPKRAADMANAFIEELRVMNKGLSVTEAAQRRLFFEEQLKDEKDSLSKAEEAMKSFQEKTGVVKIDTQATAVIENISHLKAQIAAKEVQIKVMRTYLTSQNPDIQRAEEELKGTVEQLGRLESKNEDGSALVPTGNIPSASTEYVRRMRDLKFNETLYGLLLNQYEAAKLDEARDATVIQVIEKAVPPEKKVKPKRMQMVILTMIASLFVSIFAAFFIEYMERIKIDPENKERVETLKRYISFRQKENENIEEKEIKAI